PGAGDDSTGILGPNQAATAVQCCDGAFEISMPSGSYTLVAAVNNLTARVAVNVGDGDVDGVVLAIGRAFNLKGTVTFEGRAPTPAEVSAFRINLALDPPVNGLFATGYSNVLPGGSFTLPAGRGDFRISIAPLLSAPGVFVFP